MLKMLVLAITLFTAGFLSLMCYACCVSASTADRIADRIAEGTSDEKK